MKRIILALIAALVLSACAYESRPFAYATTGGVDYYGIKINGSKQFVNAVICAFDTFHAVDEGCVSMGGYAQIFDLIGTSGLKSITAYTSTTYSSITGEAWDKRVIGFSDQTSSIYLLNESVEYSKYDELIFHETMHIRVQNKYPYYTEIQKEAKVREGVAIYRRIKSLVGL